MNNENEEITFPSGDQRTITIPLGLEDTFEVIDLGDGMRRLVITKKVIKQ